MSVDSLLAAGPPGASGKTLGLGTAPLGGMYTAVSDEDAAATHTRAWDLGLRIFDTAPQYGNGLAEIRLGAFLRTKPRDSYTLATKVGRLLRMPPPGAADTTGFRGTPPERPVFNFSYDGVMRSLDESLARLGLDRVDIVHIHDPDDHFEDAVAGALPALRRLRDEGAVGAIGCGMNQSEILARFAGEGGFDCFLLAGRYTLLDQSALATLLPRCIAEGIRIVVGGAFNSGILADPVAAATFNYRPASPDLMARAQRLAAICGRHGVPLKAAALQFPAAHPAVATILAGARSAAEIAENDTLFRIAIPAALWPELQAAGLLPADAPTPNTI